MNDDMGTQGRTLACLFHTTVEGAVIHKVKDSQSDLWVTYGLCTRCEGDLLIDKTAFAIRIDKQICKNLNKKGMLK